MNTTDRLLLHIAGLLLTMTSVVVATDSVTAAEYSYYPPYLRLGAGLDLKSPLEPLPYCFTFKKAPIESSAISSRFSTSLITSRRDMLDQLGISASVSGRYQFFGGGASASYDESYRFSSDNLSWAVRVTTDYGRQEITDEQLKSPFDAMINSAPSDFARRCGTELITEERRSSTVAAIYTLSHITEERQKQLAASFNASVTTGAWDAKAEASFHSFVTEAARSSALKLDVVAIGGKGASGLASLLTDYGDLAKVTASLRNYAESLDFTSAAPTSFLSTSMQRYGWNGQTSQISVLDLTLADYYLIFRDAEAVRARANEAIQVDSALPSPRISAERRAELSNDAKTAESLMYSVAAQSLKCRDEVNACLPASNFVLPAVRWPNTETLRSVTNVANDVSCSPSGMDLIAGGTSINFLCQQKTTLALVVQPSQVKSVQVSNADETPVKYSLGDDTPLAQWVTASSAPVDNVSREKAARAASELASERLSFSDVNGSQLIVRKINISIPFGSAISSPHPLPLAFRIRVNSGLSDAVTRDISLQ